MSLKKKKLLILGANPETAGLVRTAKEMGIYTIVTDYLPGSYAKKVADASYDVDGLDVDGLIELGKKETVDGLMVGTADPLILPYYKVCKALNLPCYVTEKSASVLTNKRKFKDVCANFGICGVPEYSLAKVRDNKNIPYPLLIKPADGRSGKGMSVCYSPAEVDGAVKKALDFSMCKEVLIERYMECADVFMYYTFSGGNYYLSAMPDRYTSREQKGYDPVVLGAVYPSRYTDLYMRTLHERLCDMFRFLNIENGVLLIQAFVENNRFYVYDPGFRLQGEAPHILLNEINGFDQQRMLINFALTGSMGAEDMEQKNDCSFHGKTAASQVILLKKGVIHKIRGIDEAKRFPGVVAATQRLFEGDEVTMAGTEQQILVRFHMVCESRAMLSLLVEKINRTVQAFDEAGQNMCLKGLQPEWKEPNRKE